MKLDELLSKLTALKEEHGNLEIGILSDSDDERFVKNIYGVITAEDLEDEDGREVADMFVVQCD